MRTLALDEKNNIIATQNWQFLNGIDALRQDIKNKLSMFKNEYPFDTTEGIDYISLLSVNQRDDLQNEILNEILTDSRVKNAKILSSSFDKNKLIFNIEVTTNQNEVFNV